MAFKYLTDKEIDKLNDAERASYYKLEDAELERLHKERFNEAVNREYSERDAHDDLIAGFSLSMFMDDAQAKALALIDSPDWEPASPADACKHAGIPIEVIIDVLPELQEQWRRFKQFKSHPVAFGKTAEWRGGRMWAAYVNMLSLLWQVKDPSDSETIPTDRNGNRVMERLMRARFDKSDSLHGIMLTAAILETAMNGTIDSLYECGEIDMLGLSHDDADSYMAYGSNQKAIVQVLTPEYADRLPDRIPWKSAWDSDWEPEPDDADDVNSDNAD